MSNQTGIEVSVRDNDVEQALKALKRKIARDGLLKQLKYKRGDRLFLYLIGGWDVY